MHSAHVNPGAEPAGGGGIAEAMEVPFCWIELGAGRDLLAALVEEAVIKVAFRRREDERAVRYMRVPAKDLRYFFGEWDGAFFPIFRQKRILRFCPDVDAPVREVQVRPVERLEFAAVESCREH